MKSGDKVLETAGILVPKVCILGVTITLINKTTEYS
ncbi:hypothetical protein KS2013_2130 [Kangiella sediminilitoris]|uniref:Uncharacterized protein n=1 Tax=Kangiella sediminilitoris TaxID=1144748 RepID=A0A1B3BDH8_9GAMM|nr:hypothetical protein KS2013_2130 [Kangiella sediminilitoris]